MGKKKATSGLGRALIRERVQNQRGLRAKDSWLHTSELNDGYDWGRLNLQSVTEQSSLDDFLATAELAGTEFVAEKLNIKFVPAEERSGLLSPEETSRISKLQEENKQFLSIPRRPAWNASTSAEILQQLERETFLQWRRQLAELEEEKKLILTPFERNLDFWRQLWRVIERSDIVVQIVDARNPLLFRCEDLECYVKDVNKQKENIILINKADLLTAEQRQTWATFFEKEGIKVVFWSALAEGQRLSAEGKGELEEIKEHDGELLSEEESENEEQQEATPYSQTLAYDNDTSEEYEDCEEDEGWQTCSEDEERISPDKDHSRTLSKVICNQSHLVERDELLEIFKSVHTGQRIKKGQITVGLVGYPNVGKSSTINTILGNKKVSVSATPGHTKHFQRIPRYVLETIYGINIIRPREDDDQDRPPTSEELLRAYGYMRGFMTSHGQPDQPRSARYILKDYVNGKLLYCHPPPGIEPSDFQPQFSKYRKENNGQTCEEVNVHSRRKTKQIENVVDKNFFHQENVRALTKGVQTVMGYKPGSGRSQLHPPLADLASGKPWKKHGNKNKKEKIRRINKHLDA
ncbi:hypothetical protein GDO86_010043 [Hymenochirus boettgeri]|uniref:Large subunit GTPase 1 homolog n=1 Tax=Hymenochirus boettgeri TaxID=247094 RepID=A0A8T2JRC5_9PIPI|nr:hypothetical protein GDO86_010043 [Hymenochirus boettgeri]